MSSFDEEHSNSRLDNVRRYHQRYGWELARLQVLVTLPLVPLFYVMPQRGGWLWLAWTLWVVVTGLLALGATTIAICIANWCYGWWVIRKHPTLPWPTTYESFLNEEVSEWTKETLGYIPRPLYNESSMDIPVLMAFRSDKDLLVYRMRWE